MRYRPLGATGTVVSAVSVALTEVPNRRRMEDWRDIVYGALECGVNAFEIVGHSPAIIEGLGEALRSVDRHLVFVSQRLGDTPNGRNFGAHHLAMTVESTIARTGLEYLDLCLLADPASHELSADAMAALKGLKAAGRARLIGVGGVGPELEAYVSSGNFDALAMPYNIASGWMERHLLKSASQRDMVVIGYDFWPEILHTPEDHGLGQMVKRVLWGKPKTPSAASLVGTYDFLHHTSGWTAEDLCLAYALTEPSIATLQLNSDATPRLAHLAEMSEKDMPNGVASRIEMARFAGNKNTG